MTINDAYIICQSLTQKDRNGLVQPERFNVLAEQAQITVGMNRYGNNRSDNPQMKYAYNKKQEDDLLPLLGIPTPLTVDVGYVLLPKDYWHTSSLSCNYFRNGKGTSVVAISELTNAEFVKKLESKIVPPTSRYPISTKYSDTLRIEPKTITKVDFTYIRKPKTPYWDYDMVNNRAAYKESGQSILANPTYKGMSISIPRLSQSQDFELPFDCHMEIVMEILKNLGVVLSQGDLTQYADTLIKQGI